MDLYAVHHGMRNRRSFMKLSAALAGSAVLTACGLGSSGEMPAATIPIKATSTTMPPPTATKTATMTPELPMNTTGRVVLVRTQERADGIKRALELWDHNTVEGKSLFVKPNFNSADPFPGSTDIDTLHTLIDQLKNMGAGALTIGDRSGMGNTRAVMQSKGIFNLADEFGLSTIVFDELAEEDWEIWKPEGSHWAYGFAIPKALNAAEGIVQTCCLKTHRYGGHFTLSLKNSVGFAAKRIAGSGYDYMTELHNSVDQRRMIAEINSVYQPELIVMDGMEAFIEGGPARGTKVSPGVILVGSDRVAVDSVGVAILRHYGTTREVSSGRIFEQEQIARAVELGLGVATPEGIEIVTGDDSSAEFAKAIEEQLLS